MATEYSIADSVNPQREYYSQQEVRSGQRDSDTPSLPASTARCMIMIPELRWKIFRLVHDFSMALPRNKTLLALALTCKSFTGPALDLLWENLNDGLAPLIRCLPQSLWKKVERKLEFQRAMTFDDWSIFCKYNHRVRSLDTSPYAAIRLDIEIWRTLSCPPFPLPLLPNLMSLIWNETTNETFLYTSLFATPKLTTLSIQLSMTFTFGPSEQSVLSCISMLCPSVSHFYFHSLGESSLGGISTALQSWSHLKSVTTGRISEAAILHLSTLPLLQVLHFELPPMPISANTQKLLQRPVFCALQELGIRCKGSPALLGTFFEKLSIAPKVISCDTNCGVDSMPALPALISRLSDTCAHSSLEQVQFNIIDRLEDHNTSIGAAAFRPLFTFRNLRKLRFYACCNVQLNDTILLQMAKAWPLLEDLYFNAYHNLSHDVTPHAFVSLLQHCPRLVSVAVFINWSTIDGRDIPPAVPYQGFSHNALSKAYFGSPIIRHPTRIAAFISAIAPNVESINAWAPHLYEERPDFEKYSTRWKLVQHSVVSFSMIRQQERRTKLNTCAGADEVEVGGDVDGGGEGEEEDSGSEGEYTPHSDQASSDPGEE